MLFSGYFCNFRAHKVTSAEDWQMLYYNPWQSVWSRHITDHQQVETSDDLMHLAEATPTAQFKVLDNLLHKQSAEHVQNRITWSFT